jgi:osomolarity two-component system sensor histidine kinase SLN1
MTDAQSALDSGGYASLMQMIIYPRNDTGNINGLLNITNSVLALPYKYPNGTVSRLKFFSS